ncbi:hypothetical protein [Candidatus Ponderosibacter sp. Uisw_141_02]|uniref:hypothetical protein n=1 Tax=Candidatus Ponderosibacter sp. Uisw_141_02 TaxID=3231000 RepID=UPI003D3E1499
MRAILASWLTAQTGYVFTKKYLILISKYLEGCMVDRALKAARVMLKNSKIEDEVFSAELLNKGGNNRLYRIEGASNQYLLKSYFVCGTSHLERIKREFSFLEYANEYAPEFVPSPIAFDLKSGFGLMDFIEGSQKFNLKENPQFVSLATKFIKKLNPQRGRGAMLKLPDAAEAEFSFQGHFGLIHNRLRSLAEIEVSDTLDITARNIANKLAQNWPMVIQKACAKIEKYCLSPNANLPARFLCASPSDFGFHNAINPIIGNLRFIDFEYAGKDDPAKLICDFFEQVACPIPKKYEQIFISQIGKHFDDEDFISLRVEILRPLYVVKWICIILNVFRESGRKRTSFAHDINLASLHEVKALQLLKAQEKVEAIL